MFHPWYRHDRLCSRTKLWNKNKSLRKSVIGLTQKPNLAYRFTSSALWAMKNPCVLASIFAPRGLIEILLSLSSVPLISIANRSSLSFVKQSLWNSIKINVTFHSLELFSLNLNDYVQFRAIVILTIPRLYCIRCD